MPWLSEAWPSAQQSEGLLRRPHTVQCRACIDTECLLDALFDISMALRGMLFCNALRIPSLMTLHTPVQACMVAYFTSDASLDFWQAQELLSHGRAPC